MPNWDKLVRKHAADSFEDGEELLATIFVLPRGGVMRAGVAGGVGGVLGGAGAAAGMRAGAESAMREAEEAADAQTIAGSFPICFGLVSITDRRVLVFDRGSVTGKRPQQLVAACPRGLLVGATAEKAGLKRDVTLRFSDGSSVALDGGLKGPYDEFVAAAAAG